VFTTHLVQWSSWVFATQKRMKGSNFRQRYGVWSQSVYFCPIYSTQPPSPDLNISRLWKEPYRWCKSSCNPNLRLMETLSVRCVRPEWKTQWKGSTNCTFTPPRIMGEGRLHRPCRACGEIANRTRQHGPPHDKNLRELNLTPIKLWVSSLVKHFIPKTYNPVCSWLAERVRHNLFRSLCRRKGGMWDLSSSDVTRNIEDWWTKKRFQVKRFKTRYLEKTRVWKILIWRVRKNASVEENETESC